MNKYNQKPTDMFNKLDVTAYLRYIKILKDQNILNFRLHIPEAIFIKCIPKKIFLNICIILY